MIRPVFIFLCGVALLASSGVPPAAASTASLSFFAVDAPSNATSRINDGVLPGAYLSTPLSRPLLLRSLGGPPPPASPTTALARSRSGALVATGHADGTVRLHDAVGNGAFRVLFGHAVPVVDLAFSPDGRHLASRTDGRVDALRVWRTRDGANLSHIAKKTSAVRDVAFSPDGRYMAWASGVSVKFWNLARKTRFVLTAKGVVISLAFSPDGGLLTTVTRDSAKVTRDQDAVRTWSMATGSFVSTFREAGVKPFSASLTGQHVACRTREGGTAIWDNDNGGRPHSNPGPISSFDDPNVVYGPAELLATWTARTVSVRHVDAANWPLRTIVLTNKVQAVWFDPDEQYLVTFTDASLQVWTVRGEGEGPVFTLEPEAAGGGTGQSLMTFMAAAPGLNLQTVATADSRGTVRIWRIAG